MEAQDEKVASLDRLDLDGRRIVDQVPRDPGEKLGH